MTPAEVEAEAERPFAVWASTLALPADWKLPGEVTRAAWLAVAEASLRARADVTAERDHLMRREQSIIEACERVADGGRYRADIVSAIQRLRRERDDALAMLTKADEAIDACEDAHDRSTFSSWEVAGKRVREYREARRPDQAKRAAERAS